MDDFVFEVDITVVVRVLAADESAARKAVSTVLRTPSAAEVRLLNEANVFFTGATVTGVDFLQIGPAQITSALSATGAAPQRAAASTRRLRSRSRHARKRSPRSSSRR